MPSKIVTVFGGAGFLGRFLIRTLCRQGWRVRVATRRPHLAGDARLAGDVGQVQLIQANVRNRASVRRAIEGSDAVVNLVSILYENGNQTFNGTQSLGGANVAQVAAELGVKTFVYMSAIGASLESHSSYARTKAEAEAATLEAIPTATILRPSVMFGPEDGFFAGFAHIARLLPIMPVIGGGSKFQPIYAGDVASAVAAALAKPEARGQTYELGGPRTYTMTELLKYITHEIDRPRLMLPIPLLFASPMGYTTGAIFKIWPISYWAPPITGDQVQMLQVDTIVAAGAKTIADLGVTNLETVESITPTYLWRHRPHGQFQPPHVEEISRADA